MCPILGGPMYTNVCGKNRLERGKYCDYNASLRIADIELLVSEAVKELVRDAFFVKEIKKRIGYQIDANKIDREITNYKKKLIKVWLHRKSTLLADAKYHERKIHDMTVRMDELYEVIVNLETRIEGVRLLRVVVETEAIYVENLFKIMQNFGELYAIVSDEERKAIISYLIKEIQICPHDEADNPLKSIEFNSPIYHDGQELKGLLREKGNTVECAVLMSRVDGE